MPACRPEGFLRKGIPLGNAGIHFENKDSFVDSRFRGNDKLVHYRVIVNF